MSARGFTAQSIVYICRISLWICKTRLHCTEWLQ